MFDGNNENDDEFISVVLGSNIWVLKKTYMYTNNNKPAY